MKKLSIIRVFLRSFLLEATWNYERMQNIGFLYSIFPCLKDIYSDDREGLKKAALRHLDFFNTNPYVSNFIMALILTMEQSRHIKHNVKEEYIKAMKLHTGGPMAAIGDMIFWARWKPLCGIITVGGVLLKGCYDFSCLYFVLIMFAVYNIPHIAVRVWGFWLGLKYSADAVGILSKVPFKKISFAFQIIGLLISFFVLLKYLEITGYLLMGAAASIVFYFLLKRGISLSYIFWTMVLLCAMYGIAVERI